MQRVVLVLGAAGELGQSVVSAFTGAEWVVLAAFNSAPPSGASSEARWLKVQLGNEAGTVEEAKRAFEDLLRRESVACVVNCAVCKHDAGQDKEAVREFIVDRTVQVVGAACASAGVRLLQMSTDVVFDGNKGSYSESDPTSAVLWYGECKASMEAGLAAVEGLDYVCLRTSLILTLEPSLSKLMGANPKRSKCAHFCISRTLAAYAEGSMADFFTDEVRSVTLGSDLALAIASLAGLEETAFRDKVRGVLNLVASESITRYQLAEALICYYSTQLARPLPALAASSSREIFKGTRPLDCSLETAKYRALQETLGLPGLRPVLAVLVQAPAVAATP